MAPEIRFPNLGISINELSNTAFSIGGFNIQWYGVIVTIAVFAGLGVALLEVRRTKQDVNHYFDFFFIVVIACIVGSRLFYVAFAWEDYRNNLLAIFNLRSGGLAIYGVVLAAIITAVIYNLIKKYDFWTFADTGIFGLITGQIIGRWANFINREAFGGYTEGFLAMQYRADTVPWSMVREVGQITVAEGAEYIQVHPTFLYESLWNLGLIVIMWLYKYFKPIKGFADGEIFFLYLIGYGAGRFWMEGLRTDSLMLFNTDIRVSQGLSLVLIIVGVGLTVYRRIAVKLKPRSI
jgi:phosphatidylglycerol:prolipoprotein diacylglycerol transferase